MKIVSAKDLDRALAAPITEVGPRVIGLREDQWFDRKSVRAEPKSLAHVLVAFANAEGGVVVVGVSNGSVEGVKAQAHKLNDYRQIAIDHTVPPVRCQIDQVGCINSMGEPDSLVVIRVDPGESVHETKSGD